MESFFNFHQLIPLQGGRQAGHGFIYFQDRMYSGSHTRRMHEAVASGIEKWRKDISTLVWAGIRQTA